MPKVFISYRRADSQHAVDRLYAALKKHLNKRDIFIDVDSIPKGVDFVDHLSHQVEKCEVVLAIIGPNWLDASGPDGRRIDLPHDFVRIEIESALKRDIPIIPVLLDGTQMPSANDLPAALQNLSRRNAINLRRDAFTHDIGELLLGLGVKRKRSGKILATSLVAIASAVAAGTFAFSEQLGLGDPSHWMNLPNDPAENLVSSEPINTDVFASQEATDGEPDGERAQALDRLRTAFVSLGSLDEGVTSDASVLQTAAIAFESSENISSPDVSSANAQTINEFAFEVEKAVVRKQDAERARQARIAEKNSIDGMVSSFGADLSDEQKADALLNRFSLSSLRRVGYGGNLELARILGDAYKNGYKVDKDYEEARKLFDFGCDRDHAESCTDLGRTYVWPDGATRYVKDPEGERLLKKACELGSLSGCNRIGLFYTSGSGYHSTFERGLSYLKQACENGYVKSCSNGGSTLMSNGRVSDESEARSVWFNVKGCELGDLSGCYIGGSIIAAGYHPDYQPDIPLGLLYLEKGCAGGDNLACTEIDKLDSR